MVMMLLLLLLIVGVVVYCGRWGRCFDLGLLAASICNVPQGKVGAPALDHAWRLEKERRGCGELWELQYFNEAC
jgi:hypothetical protein